MTSDAPTTQQAGLKPWITYSILGLAVLVGGYFIYAALLGEDELPATLMCKECGNIRTEALAVGEMLPAACSKCGKTAMVPAFRCENCRTVNVWNENRGLPPPTKCTKCGQEASHGR